MAKTRAGRAFSARPRGTSGPKLLHRNSDRIREADTEPSPLIDENKPLAFVPKLIFASRWLQLPLYLGLIVAQVVYVFLFIEELIHLVELLWNPGAIDATVQRLGIAERNKETVIMIIVLSLIDVVMISNLLIMVIVGGYETFVSRLRLEGHPDQPEWLSHVNANVLKVKLATAIIGISSIHLLKSFIATGTLPQHVLLWQTVIHGMFLVSAIAIALIDRLMTHASSKAKAGRDSAH
jgi:uncharacterized protein (TIGR00645 family)